MTDTRKLTTQFKRAMDTSAKNNRNIKNLEKRIRVLRKKYAQKALRK